MKTKITIFSFCAMVAIAPAGEEPSKDQPSKVEAQAQHKEGSDKVAEDQDELSADVEQLVIEQTQPKVIELLGKVEDLMDEATEKLATADTGSDTIAAQTEIIELIHAAAKEKQCDCNKPGSGAMMDMMERMMGKKPDEGQPKPGGKEADNKKGGGGVTGDSDTASEAVAGAAGGNGEARKVPKAAGSVKIEIPEEFRKAFDAYNRGAEKKAK